MPAVSLGAWFGTWVEKRLGITGVGLLAGGKQEVEVWKGW